MYVTTAVRANIVNTLLCIALLTVTAPTWLQWVEPSPLSYRVPYRVINAPVPAGELLTFVAARCNSSSQAIPISITRALVPTDGTTAYAMGVGYTVVLPGCASVQSQATSVPEYVPPGEYVLENVISYQGRWREFHTRTYTEPFRVVAP